MFRLIAVSLALLAASHAYASDLPPMEVDDYVVDATRIAEGDEVVVSGSAMCMANDICFLTKGTNVTVQLIFSPVMLTRENRKQLLNCNPITHPCRAILHGKTTGDLLHSVAAESISFQK